MSIPSTYGIHQSANIYELESHERLCLRLLLYYLAVGLLSLFASWSSMPVSQVLQVPQNGLKVLGSIGPPLAPGR